MQRRVRLSDVAAVRGGFVPSAVDARERRRREDEEERQRREEERGRLRRSSSAEGDGPLRVPSLQPSAIKPDGTVAWSELAAILPVRDEERYAIREGELLLPLRSQRVQAVIAQGVPGLVLAVGQWALIAPDPQEADAAYLAWYLNHPRTRARLEATMVGTSLQFLTVSTVRDFEVELPDLTTQRLISRAVGVTARVNELEQRLAAARLQLVDALAMRVAQRGSGAHN